MRAYWLVVSVLCVRSSVADDEVQTGGSVEQVLSSGSIAGKNHSGDRFTRASLFADGGAWQARVSYWYYPFCGWYDLDDTNITYTKGKVQLKVGRFLAPVGQVNWDREWYSGFVFVPNQYLLAYSGRKLFERTSPGASAEVEISPSSKLTVSTLDSKADTNRPLPHDLDRIAVKFNHYHDGLTLGASALTDSRFKGDKEQLLAADFHYAKPRWSVSGEYIHYQSRVEKSNGYILEAAYRPESPFDHSFHARFEDMRGSGLRPKIQIWTLGLSFRAPLSSRIYINYTGGPGINQTPLGKNWSASFLKTINF